jgi:hypothetical protein
LTGVGDAFEADAVLVERVRLVADVRKVGGHFQTSVVEYSVGKKFSRFGETVRLGVRIQKPVVIYDIVGYYRKAVCTDLFATLPNAPIC